MLTPHVYLNGNIIPVDQAAISPFDIGLLRGYAVFDLLRTVKGVPFLFEEHLLRLHGSAARLNLVVPVSDEEIRSAVSELLALNGHQEATVRIVLTGGVSPDGMAYDSATPTLLILTHELHEPPAEIYETGAALTTLEHLREIPTAKTTNYLTMLVNRPATQEAEALDVLYCHGGRVLEAASASVYFVRDGVILAPAADVLHGTIGTLAQELARPDHQVRLASISLEEAFAAGEVFLTSTTRGVVPIVRIDGRAIGDGTPGVITRELISRYRSLLATPRP